MSPARLIAAADLIEAQEAIAWDGNPPWMNVIFRKRHSRGHELRGPGLYALFLDRELLYIGIYAGKTSNLLGGSVLDDRWLKHVGTLTLRGKKVSVREATLRELRKHPAAALVADILKAGPNLTRGQGMEASLKKVLYAARRWHEFTGPLDAVLARVEFGYVRAPVESLVDLPSKAAAKAFLEKVETDLLCQLSPPLNSAKASTSSQEGLGPEHVMPLIVSVIATSMATWDWSSAATKGGGKAKVRLPAAIDPADIEDDPAVRFTAELPAAAEAFVADLVARLDADQRFMIWFTHSGRQIRLGLPANKGRRRPVVIMEWLSRKRRFLCRFRSRADVARALGFADARSILDPEMRSAFEVEPGSVRADRLLEACARFEVA